MKNLSLKSLVLALVIALSGIQTVSAVDPVTKPAQPMQAELDKKVEDTETQVNALLKEAKKLAKSGNDAEANAKFAEYKKAQDELNAALQAANPKAYAPKSFFSKVKSKLSDAKDYAVKNKKKTAGASVALVAGVALAVAAYKYMGKAKEKVKSLFSANN